MVAALSSLIGGLGILLYGLTLFEDSLRVVGGKKLKKRIIRYTTNGRLAILVGMMIAGVFSSASVLTLMIIALTGAGILPLRNAIGLILGANIGTTFDDFLIAWLGFGVGVDISALALPIVGIAGVGLLILRHPRLLTFCKLIFGFGLLFIGLHFMKDAMQFIQSSDQLLIFEGLSLLGRGFLGAGVTAILQLMGAVAILVFSALDVGILTFPQSIAILMGANVGSTINAVIASFGGRAVKRQVALSHVLFNTISSLFGIALFRQFVRLTTDVFGFPQNAVGSAFFNVLFNLSTVLIFGMFLGPFTHLITRLLPEKGGAGKLVTEQFTLESISEQSIEPLLTAFKADTSQLLSMLVLYRIYKYHLPREQGTHVYALLPESLTNEYAQKKSTLGDDIEEMVDTLLRYHQKASKEYLSKEQTLVLASKTKTFQSIIRVKNAIDIMEASFEELAGYDLPELHEFKTLCVDRTTEIFRGCIKLLVKKVGDDETLDDLEYQIEEMLQRVHTTVLSHMGKLQEEGSIGVLLSIHMYLGIGLRYLFRALKNHLVSREDFGFIKL